MASGHQFLVLQACNDLPGDSAGFVDEAEIADRTRLQLRDVRDCIESLDEKGYLNSARLTDCYMARITADGRQVLRQHRPFPDEPSGSRDKQQQVKVIPKGLRAFDEHDADFFLELLPGPRRADGLPESVHFWKTRIEKTDPEKTFAVGVIFGPSGCGKSSLVRAGLLPRLADWVIRIYVEATANDTEAGLLKALRKHVPNLPGDRTLLDSLKALHEAQFDRDGTKVLVVLDQFEQWLHAKRMEEHTELVQALRQCDGVRVQAVVLVRDDFSMALIRFLDELEIKIIQGQNFAAVDLFDLRHAKKVLTAFGRAFGALPDNRDEITEGQKEFLNQAISGLSQDGRIISVRLALFAEMIKSKDWTLATLREVGGTEGVGVTFLEETFGSRQANPEHRVHQKAVQHVLKALLPESGTDIKGHMKSYQALRKASGYADHPNEFDDLLRILDSETRLITPTDPEGMDTDEGERHAPGGKYYQLTHDYLVPSLREWLTRKQKETRRGRAELRLAERAASWNAKPENRHLPSVWEWANIRLLTKKRDWTGPQRKMMRKAGRYHGIRGLTLAIILVLVGWVGYESYGSLEASALVESVRTAETGDMPRLIERLAGYRRWANPLLVRLVRDSKENSKERLHARLALLPVDAGQVKYLYPRLLKASPTEVPVIREALKDHREGLVERLWRILEQPTKDEEGQQLQAASALTIYDPDNPRWRTIGGRVAEGLVSVNSVFLGDWMRALRPVRNRLTPPLGIIFRDRRRSESERSLAADVLADYAGDKPNILADLLMDADLKAFAVLYPKVRIQGQEALAPLESELAKKSTPEATDDEKDRLARRQAKAAVALIRLGRPEKVWPLLRHSPDPSVRSYIVNWLKPLGADPKALMAELESLDRDKTPTPSEGQSRMEAILFHLETSMRRALILALGQYGTEWLTPGDREPLMKKLLDLYETDPDAGIHGAAEWTLRQWGQQKPLKERDAELMKVKDWGDRRWCVNSQGQTFAVIEGPVEFSMGSPPTEPDRFDSELLHRRRIPRRFAIAAQEVTVEQYQVFVNENRGVDHAQNDRYSPDRDGPMNGVTWYHATAYCNWLSRKEGLPECYEPNERSGSDEGMRIKADALKLKGYRLPTEAEWEYACRAGAETSRYYGASVDLLGSYARYIATSQDRAWPCGSLLPNDLGLFDTLGNVYEWCQDRAEPYKPEDGMIIDNINIQEDVLDRNPRLFRGGTFGYQPAYVRSAGRYRDQPSYRIANLGFRPARTYP
jgi:eukaryotic-like serine/threonine-protein kinase